MRYFIFVVALCLMAIGSIQPLRHEYNKLISAKLPEKRLSADKKFALAKLATLTNLRCNDNEVLAAKLDLADIYTAQQEYKEADNLYVQVFELASGKAKSGSADLYNRAGLGLARLCLNTAAFPRAEKYYKAIWAHDKANLPEGNPSLIRDINNLGTVSYLLAMSTPNLLEKELELNRANFYLIQTQMLYALEPNHDVQQEADSLDNRYLVLRELGNIKQAEMVKNQAQRLHAQLPERINSP